MAVFKLVVPFKYKATRRLTALRQRLAKKKATNCARSRAACFAFF